MTKRTAVTAIALSAATMLTTGAQAREVGHRGTLRVCAGGWVEKAPAHRPIAPAYAGDRFTIARPKLAVVHHSDGRVERFARGRLTRRDAKSHQVYRYEGWISTRILTGGSSCP
ncbi:MAG TPA: hypothetical protein VGF63_15170 [Solirubrobacteraceae bacterium]